MNELIVKWLETNLPAMAGAFVYGLYSIFFQKTPAMKALVAFVIGSITANYAAPQLTAAFPSISIQFSSFFLGVMGMKITEAFLALNLKKHLTDLWEKILAKF